MRTNLKLFSRLSLMAWLLFCCPYTAGRIQQNTEEESKNLVVMIKSRFEGMENIGAGIIIGLKSGQLYIATAEHLVSIRNQNAREIAVTFKWHDKPVTANLLKHTGRP